MVNIIGDNSGSGLSPGGGGCGDCNGCGAGGECDSGAYYTEKKKKYGFRIRKQDFKISSQCKRFIKVGLPLALQEFLTRMSFLALCAFINKLGLEASSGYGVALPPASVFF